MSEIVRHGICLSFYIIPQKQATFWCNTSVNCLILSFGYGSPRQVGRPLSYVSDLNLLGLLLLSVKSSGAAVKTERRNTYHRKPCIK